MNIKMTIGKMVVSDCRQTRFSSSLSTVFFACTNLDVDWNVGHSLSAGGPETLASRRLDRQSAEREQVPEINWNVFYIFLT